MEKFELNDNQHKDTEIANGDVHQNKRKLKGLTLWTAAIFILGEMAGSGVLALPHSVVNSGWVGIALIILFCITSGISGTRLGECWIMLEERYPEYRQEVRNPYPSIAYRAYGNKMRHVLTFCVNFTLFGVGTVFLLLSAKLVQSCVATVFNMSFCYWTLIIAAILTPCMWLGTPKDFWPVAVGAAVTTAIACVIIVIRCILDKANSHQDDITTYPAPTFGTFSLAFGTILFSYGGASTFPTIQNDMRDRTQFTRSVIIAFIGLLILYVPVAATGYILFGGNIKENILDGLSQGPDIVTVQILLAAHLFFAFVIIINPFCQQAEQVFKIPNSFTWKRCLLRTVIMMVIVFVGETVPHFGKILNLVGGSTITLMTFVFPPLFYMALVDKDDPKCPKRKAGIPERIFLWSLVVIGVCGGISATYFAIWEIAAPDAFSLPCYISH